MSPISTSAAPGQAFGPSTCGSSLRFMQDVVGIGGSPPCPAGSLPAYSAVVPGRRRRTRNLEIPGSMLPHRPGMTSYETQVRILATCIARVLPVTSPFRNERAQGRPGARRTRGPVCKNCAKSAHGRNHRQGGITPALPAQWFTAYSVLSPVNQLGCHRRRRDGLSIVANLAPAWARQDHTASPPVKAAARRSAAFRVHRIPLHVRDDAYAPRVEAGCGDNTSNQKF